LDAGHGSQILRNPVAGRLVQEALLHGHGSMYELHAWSVMPTHVHVVLTPNENWALGNVVGRIKGRSSRYIGQRLTFVKPLWQPDYFDRWIRDSRHFEAVVRYVEWNPVKAKLCSDPAAWTCSSANPLMADWVREGEPGCTSPGYEMRAKAPRSGWAS
jgi:REP element-mobilizing transposase RayT